MQTIPVNEETIELLLSEESKKQLYKAVGKELADDFAINLRQVHAEAGSDDQIFVELDLDNQRLLICKKEPQPIVELTPEIRKAKNVLIDSMPKGLTAEERVHVAALVACHYKSLFFPRAAEETSTRMGLDNQYAVEITERGTNP